MGELARRGLPERRGGTPARRGGAIDHPDALALASEDPFSTEEAFFFIQTGLPGEHPDELGSPPRELPPGQRELPR